MNSDTIVAISTFPGESGIGIIRVTGPEAISICSKIFINKFNKHILHTYKSHTIHYGYVIDTNETIIDEVMVSVLKAPNTYTCEDTVEINCHGGIRICHNILQLVLSVGARLADPGEFTKRAFLNGRLDLTQSEAVMDIIRSESDLALNNSINQLRGSLNSQLNNICSEILYEIAFIESALDDPDSISLDGYDERLSEKINEFKKSINKLINSYDEGKIISNGINTVILGKPNAGKSSLLNILLDEERAIVTNIPGTTRDTLTETIRLGEIVLNITDTAGIRETSDPVELIGVNKAQKAIESANLIIYVADSSSKLDEDDNKILDSLKDKKLIILLNKNDLDNMITDDDINNLLISRNIDAASVIKTSMINNNGIENLKETIKNMFYSEEIKSNDHIIVTNIRHVDLLKKSISSLDKVINSIDLGMSEDLYAIDLTDAYSYLATITGREVSEDIVNEIFSKFCMGK